MQGWGGGAGLLAACVYGLFSYLLPCVHLSLLPKVRQQKWLVSLSLAFHATFVSSSLEVPHPLLHDHEVLCLTLENLVADSLILLEGSSQISGQNSLGVVSGFS